jgi:hypothetical protein
MIDEIQELDSSAVCVLRTFNPIPGDHYPQPFNEYFVYLQSRFRDSNSPVYPEYLSSKFSEEGIENERRQFRRKATKYYYKDSDLYYQNTTLKVPRVRLKAHIIESVHRTLHFQVRRTVDMIRSYGFRWPNMME